MVAGSVLVDHTTASADVAREVHAAAAETGVGFVDAPISGGQAGAESGVLTVMCGGDQTDFDRVAPVIAAYSRACNLLGGPGSGQLTKMVNQICIAGLVQGLSEGIDFAQRAGLDVGEVVDTISKGAAGSWQMENRAHTMAEGTFDYGFAIDWMRKDLRICFEEAGRNGASLPITAWPVPGPERMLSASSAATRATSNSAGQASTVAETGAAQRPKSSASHLIARRSSSRRRACE